MLLYLLRVFAGTYPEGCASLKQPSGENGYPGQNGLRKGCAISERGGSQLLYTYVYFE